MSDAPSAKRFFSVVDQSDVADVTAILRCVAEDLDREACEARCVEVSS